MNEFEKNAFQKYADMLDLPHFEPDPVKHPRMSLRDRAAQFAPFAALNGFEEMIESQE
ncbi:MAG: hypothetical protein IKX45_00760 [Bacteroidales bacterium]|nr:hypothetical protein [Bacteroidales bacterium]